MPFRVRAARAQSPTLWPLSQRCGPETSAHAELSRQVSEKGIFRAHKLSLSRSLSRSLSLSLSLSLSRRGSRERERSVAAVGWCREKAGDATRDSREVCPVAPQEETDAGEGTSNCRLKSSSRATHRLPKTRPCCARAKSKRETRETRRGKKKKKKKKERTKRRARESPKRRVSRGRRATTWPLAPTRALQTPAPENPHAFQPASPIHRRFGTFPRSLSMASHVLRVPTSHRWDRIPHLLKPNERSEPVQVFDGPCVSISVWRFCTTRASFGGFENTSPPLVWLIGWQADAARSVTQSSPCPAPS